MPTKQRRARRLRCLGHVINLSAKAFLFGTEYDAFEKDIESTKEKSELLQELKLWRRRGPVGRLHNIITYICRSPQRREKFRTIKTITDEEGDFNSEFDHLSLKVDNATRWNSLYLMIERAIKLKDRIDLFCLYEADNMHGSSMKKAYTPEEKERLLKHDKLEKEDWDALNDVMAILKKFYDLTKRGEGTSLTGDRGILSNYMTTLNDLLSHIRKARDDIEQRLKDPDQATESLKYLKVCIVNCWTKLDSYFLIIDETPAHYASVVTNPIMKWKYFEHTWRDAVTWKDATNPETWLITGREALNSIWKEYRDLPVDDDIPTSGSKRARSPDDYERSFDMTLLYGDDEDLDELESWISSKVEKLSGSETLGQFWQRLRKQKSTNRLARMALDMLSIPAMSSDCERVFSQAKLLITGQRHSLKPDIIEATQCLRAWLITDKKKIGTWQGSGNWTVPHEISTGSWE
jgi:hypothetical protein